MWDKASPLPGIPGRGLLRLVEGRRGRGEQEGENPHGGEVRPGKLQVMAGCAGGENWGGRDSKTPGLGRGSAGGSVVAFEMDAGFFAGFLQEFRHVHGQPGAGGVLLF